MKKKLVIFFLLFLLLLYPQSAKASSLDEFDFSEIDAWLEEEGEENNLDFKELVTLVINGDFKQVATLCFSKIKSAGFASFRENQSTFRRVLLLSLFLAIYTTIAKAFKEQTMSQTGFYVVYLVLIVLLLSSFEAGYTLAYHLLQKMLSLLTVLFPIFYLSVAYAGNQAAAAGYYQVSILLMGGIEWLFIELFFPFIRIYTVLTLLNEISSEHLFSGFLSLGKKVIKTGSKALLAAVTGMQVIQGLILPQADAVKNQALIKAVSVIPGVGGVSETMSSVLLGSGVLIRNGIGIASMCALCLICIIPFVEMALVVVIYHFCAALITPIADKRVTSCIVKTAESLSFLLKIMTSCLCVFLILLALVCAMTGNGV